MLNRMLIMPRMKIRKERVFINRTRQDLNLHLMG